MMVENVFEVGERVVVKRKPDVGGMRGEFLDSQGGSEAVVIRQTTLSGGRVKLASDKEIEISSDGLRRAA